MGGPTIGRLQPSDLKDDDSFETISQKVLCLVYWIHDELFVAFCRFSSDNHPRCEETTAGLGEVTWSYYMLVWENWSYLRKYYMLV